MWSLIFPGALRQARGAYIMTGNLAISTRFGATLLILRGGARNRAEFIQLNCPLLNCSMALIMYGSEFTNVDEDGTDGKKPYQKKNTGLI